MKSFIIALLILIAKGIGIIFIFAACVFMLGLLVLILFDNGPKSCKKIAANIEEKIIFPMLDFVYGKFLPAVLHRIIFLFTTKVYYHKIEKQIYAGFKDQLEKLTSEIAAEKAKIHHLVEDRNEWRRACNEKEKSIEDSYWRGVKYGYNLYDKRKEPQPQQSGSDELDRAQEFALQQVARGEATQNSSCAILQSKGYIELASGKKNQYKLSEKGIAYLATITGDARLEKMLRAVRELM